MTLREQITTDVSAVFLNTEDFAETVTYTPKGGDERPVSAVVDESERYEEVSVGGVSRKKRVTMLEVLVTRDSATGIDSPQHGDSIQRRLSGVENQAFSYTGEALEADENAWTLRFVREVVVTHGGNRRQ